MVLRTNGRGPQSAIPPGPRTLSSFSSVLKGQAGRGLALLCPDRNLFFFVDKHTPLLFFPSTMNTPTEVPVDTKPQAMLVEHADAVLTDQVPQNAAESGVDHSIAHAHGRDPSLHPDHPTNSLSNKRKWAVLLTLSWAGFVANYSASAHLTAFE